MASDETKTQPEPHPAGPSVEAWFHRDDQEGQRIHASRELYDDGVHTVRENGETGWHAVIAYVPMNDDNAGLKRLLSWMAEGLLSHNVIAMHLYPSVVLFRVRETSEQARRLYAELVSAMDGIPLEELLAVAVEESP